MSDVMERLRVANPTPQCPPPPISGVWRRIETDESTVLPTRGPEPRRERGQLATTAQRVRGHLGTVVVFACSAAVVVAVGAIVLVGRGRSSPDSTPSAIAHPTKGTAGRSTGVRGASSTKRKHAAAVDPRVAAEFSALTSPPKAGDSLPAADATALNAYRAEHPDFGGARRVTASNGQAAYLVPTDGGACAVSAFAPICAPAASLPGAFSLDLCSPDLPVGQLELEWLLPDGATNVTVRSTTQVLAHLPSGFNVYIARIPNTGSVPRSISWQQDGHQRSAIVGPPGGQTGACEHPGTSPQGSRMQTATPVPAPL